MDKLLENAINSIEIGVEDFELSKQDERRIISCTRNIFAGILLLFKYKLVELSPVNSDEVLIKQRIMPILEDENLIWKGEGKKTVDVQGIKDRFKSLNIHIDWTTLDKINEYRNNIEHYHSTQSIETVQEMIARIFPIMNDFIHNHLNEQPENLFHHETWKKLLLIQDVYEQEKEFCLTQLRKLTFYHDEILETISNHTCSECGYSLIIPSNDEDTSADCINYICKSCNKEWDYNDLIEECLDKKYKSEWWDCIKYGGEEPVVDCPECGGKYDYIEKFCYHCDTKIKDICQNCGNSISASELECAPFCGYCSYSIEKMRDE